MSILVQKWFASCLRIVNAFLIVALAALAVAACVQAPTADGEQAESTVIEKTDIEEPNRGVTTYTDDELRQTGRPDAGTALKRRDPRIN